MAKFVVRWTIEVDADTEHEAVEQAAEMLPIMGNDTTATVFEVCPEDNADDPTVKWISVDVRDWR